MDDKKHDKPEEKNEQPDARPNLPPGISLAKKVGAKEVRKLRARNQAGREVWRGLGMMGMVGWSVAVPTLVGVFVGRWLDGSYPGERSWTIALLMAGLVLGCFNAWRWVGRESRDSHDYGRDYGQDRGHDRGEDKK